MLKPDIEFLKPKIESILFVGGVPARLPKIKSSIKVTHWTIDNQERPIPDPLPDLIIEIEDKVNLGLLTKSYELSEANKIKTIKSFYYPDNIVLACANLKLDVRNIFENEESLQFPIFGPRKIMEILEKTKDDNRKRHRKVCGELAEYIIDLAKKEKFEYPLKPIELIYLADAVKKEKKETITIKQVKRLLKVDHDKKVERGEIAIQTDEQIMESVAAEQRSDPYQTDQAAADAVQPQPVEPVSVAKNDEEINTNTALLGSNFGFANDYAGESDEEKKNRLYTRDRIHNILVERIGVLQDRNEKLVSKIKILQSKLDTIRRTIDE